MIIPVPMLILSLFLLLQLQRGLAGYPAANTSYITYLSKCRWAQFYPPTPNVESETTQSCRG